MENQSVTDTEFILKLFRMQQEAEDELKNIELVLCEPELTLMIKKTLKWRKIVLHNRLENISYMLKNIN